jgi:hypothetical protein
MRKVEEDQQHQHVWSLYGGGGGNSMEKMWQTEKQGNNFVSSIVFKRREVTLLNH